MLKNCIQKEIPFRLSHHTNIDGFKGILSCDVPAYGEICFRAVSNKYKNDAREIEMGGYIQKVIKAALDKKGAKSIVQRINMYKNSASVSFMEGKTNRHMVKEYGEIRLEFDLNDSESIGIDFMDCEYAHPIEIKSYAKEYSKLITETYSRIQDSQEHFGKSSAESINGLCSFLELEIDIIQKIFVLKEYKWHNEKEWRKVVFLVESSPEVMWTPGKDSRPYKNVYYPKEALTGVTVFSKSLFYKPSKKYVEEVRDYLSLKGFNVPIYERRCPWT